MVKTWQDEHKALAAKWAVVADDHGPQSLEARLIRRRMLALRGGEATPEMSNRARRNIGMVGKATRGARPLAAIGPDTPTKLCTACGNVRARVDVQKGGMCRLCKNAKARDARLQQIGS